MHAILIAIISLVIIDFILMPFILMRIRVTGGFHYLVTVLHKFMFLVLIASFGILAISNGIQSLWFQIPFSLALLFVLESTFEINSYFFLAMDIKEFNIDGMSEKSKTALIELCEEMKGQNSKPLFIRFKDMSANFITNIEQDIMVVFMILTNNKKIKKSYQEIHEMMGNDKMFVNMKLYELMLMVKSRIMVDICSLAFSILMFFVI